MNAIDAVAEWIEFAEPMPHPFAVYRATALLDTFAMIVAIERGQQQREQRAAGLSRWADDGGRG